MAEPADFTLERAGTAGDLDAVVGLFREYAASLKIDLSYQGFEAELASMPGRYAPPAGVLLLARLGNAMPAGCVALRPVLPEGCCEMKRLYVTGTGRGLGLGRALAARVIAEAEAIGYREMRLDTLEDMHAAQALYRRLGFAAMPAYYDTPVPGTVFMRRMLDRRL